MGRLVPPAWVAADSSDLADLERGWNVLAATGDGCPTAEPEWARACADAFADEGDLHVVCVGDADSPRAIAPLVQRHAWHSRLELLGVTTLYEPTGFLFADPESLAELARALGKLGKPLLLGRLRADSPVLRALGVAFQRSGVVLSRGAGTCPYIELPPGAEPESLLSKRRRSDLRRARRHAEEHGEVTSELHSPGQAELEPLLERAFAIEAQSWKGRAGTALAVDQRRAAFYGRYAAAAAARGNLRIVFLRIGEQDAAVQLGVDSRGAYWTLKIGYDEGFSRASPGQLLMLEAIRTASERGLNRVELLGTEAAWTKVWTKSERPCISAAIYPLRPRGAAAVASDGAWLAAAALRRRLGTHE